VAGMTPEELLADVWPLTLTPPAESAPSLNLKHDC
jgi:hypothetical protein